MFLRAALLLLPLLCPARAVFQRLYCSVSDSCECDFTPRLRDLERGLFVDLFGQPLVQEAVWREVWRFLQEKFPERPLVLSLHGASGTGKTLVASMLETHLFRTGANSRFVHHFIPALHFPRGPSTEEHRGALKAWVQGNLTSCSRSLFIFDEMESMPPGVVDVLEPFLGPNHVVYSTNYRKAIYVFISTLGQEVIFKVALEARSSGRDRDEIRLSEVEEAVAQEAFSSNNTGFSDSRLISQKLVSRFVPFLPLTRVHVERCALAQLCQRGLCGRSDVARAVGGAMTYAPSPAQHFFSTTGCKSVPAKIHLFL